MKEIALLPQAEGRVALVDDEDYDRLKAFRYSVSKRGDRCYAYRYVAGTGRQTQAYLHQDVLPFCRGQIKFRNGDGLDCRKGNLVYEIPETPSSTSDKGALAEAKVIACLAARGFLVFTPFAGFYPYDVVAAHPVTHEMRRIQVKYRAAAGPMVRVHLSTMHRNSAGVRKLQWRSDIIDGLAVYCPSTDDVYFVQGSELRTGQHTIDIRIVPAPASRNTPDVLWVTQESRTIASDRREDPGQVVVMPTGNAA